MATFNALAATNQATTVSPLLLIWPPIETAERNGFEYERGYDDGYDDGDAAGQATGYATGYAVGYADGLAAFPVDETEPTSEAVTPEGELDPDFDVATVTPIEIDLTDETSIAYAGVFCSLNGAPKLVVYRRGAFEAPFDVYSTTSIPVAGTLRLHVRHNTGWPPGVVEMSTDVLDAGGNIDA